MPEEPWSEAFPGDLAPDDFGTITPARMRKQKWGHARVRSAHDEQKLITLPTFPCQASELSNPYRFNTIPHAQGLEESSLPRALLVASRTRGVPDVSPSDGVGSLKVMGICSFSDQGAPDAIVKGNGLRVGTSAFMLIRSPICEI